MTKTKATAMQNSPGPTPAAPPAAPTPSPAPKKPKPQRGPTPGKYQNGKACFSYWFPTPFLVRLRRFATNLGMDVPSLLISDYSARLSSLRLTPEDLAEIELSDKSIRRD